MTRPREPLREVLALAVVLIIGMIGYTLLRQRNAGVDAEAAIATARAFHVRGMTVDAAIAYDNPGAEVSWSTIASDKLVRVGAKAVRNSATTEYRFDVDTENGRVHPANPHARELFEAPEAPNRRE